MSPNNEHSTLEIKSFTDWAGFLNDKCLGENWLFRGQTRNWKLLPKLARLGLNLQENPLHAEKQMFDQFKLESPPHLPGSVRSDWDLLVIAQHHGMPTRLLDWSTNPLAAMWFAVETPAYKKGDPAVVWAYEFEQDFVIDQYKSNDPFSDRQSQIILRPSHIARRLVAQMGWFTVHAPIEGAFKPFEQMSNQGKLIKCTVSTEVFSDMRYHLDRCGINRSCLFPDLDGLCKHIQWKHTRLSDEPVQNI